MAILTSPGDLCFSGCWQWHNNIKKKMLAKRPKFQYYYNMASSGIAKLLLALSDSTLNAL